MKNTWRIWCTLILLTFGVLGVTGSFSPALAGDSPAGRQPEKGDKPKNPSDEKQMFVPNQLVIRLQTDMSAAAALKLDGVASVAASLSHSPVYLVNIDTSVDLAEAAYRLDQAASVVYVHPNYILNRTHVIQGSYPFPDQNVVAGRIGEQYAVRQLQLDTAHSISTGRGVTVGVIDGGIDFPHEGLEGGAVTGRDFVDDDNDATDVSGGYSSGHGTFVAGIIHLTAPDATLKAYRVMNKYGYGDGFSLAQAIEQATMDGCNVINLSLALTERHLAVRDAIDYAMTNGVTVVAGAGNDGAGSVSYPAAEVNVIAVAATDSLLHSADFSNVGTAVDVCAPGVDIYSTFLSPQYAWWSGTSFSTPFVSGLAALLISKDSLAGPLKVRSRILGGAQKIDSLNLSHAGNLGKGLIRPLVSMNMTSGSDSAVFIPNSFSLTYHQGTEFVTTPSVITQFFSTLDSAYYMMTRVDYTGSQLFSWIDDSAGYGRNGDSVQIFYNPTYLPIGVYHNEFIFYVDGVSDSASVHINLTVLPEDTTAQWAYFTPSNSHIYVPIGTGDTIVEGAVYLTSSNAPAQFRAEKWGYWNPGPHPVQLIDTMGITNDTIHYRIVSTGLTAGTYSDTLIGIVDGVQDTAFMVVTILVGVNPYGHQAWFHDLETNVYVMPYGSTNVVTGKMAIRDDNGPQAYRAWVGSPSRFITFPGDSGVTEDTITYQVSVGSLAPGTYYDTMFATVAGVDNSPIYNIVWLRVTTEGGDSAVVTPQTFSFGATAGTTTTQHGIFNVICGGSQCSYKVEYVGTPRFTQMVDTAGNTPGTARFNVVVPSTTAPGSYQDNLHVLVIGQVNQLFSVTINVNVASPSQDSAIVTPRTLGFFAPYGVNQTQHAGVNVTTLGTPKSFSISHFNTPRFTEILTTDTMLFTPDSAKFDVVTTAQMAKGNYTDTLLVTVDGAVNSPIQVFCNLTIGDPAADTAILLPSFTVDTVIHGVTTYLHRSFRVLFNGGPLAYTASSKDPRDFTHLLSTSGWTGDTTRYDMLCDYRMAAGWYTDTIMVAVEGAPNSPLYLVCMLYIKPASGDTAYVSPRQQNFTATLGETVTIPAGFAVGASGAPKTFTVTNRSWNHFTHLIDTAGTTYDTVHFEVISTPSLGAGIYYDTVDVNVFDANPGRFSVQLKLTVSAGGTITATLIPDHLSYIGVQGTYDTIMAQALFISSPGTHMYAAYVKHGTGRFLYMRSSDTTGYTNDSVYVTVLTAGLTPGVYIDTAFYYVYDMSGFVYLPIQLTIGSAQLETAELTNYPNPFNPTTTVVYSLPTAREISLDIYNVLGQHVATLATGRQEAGSHSVEWDGTNQYGMKVGSGVYFYRLQAGELSLTRKMLLLK